MAPVVAYSIASVSQLWATNVGGWLMTTLVLPLFRPRWGLWKELCWCVAICSFLQNRESNLVNWILSKESPCILLSKYISSWRIYCWNLRHLPHCHDVKLLNAWAYSQFLPYFLFRLNYFCDICIISMNPAQLPSVSGACRMDRYASEIQIVGHTAGHHFIDNTRTT